MSDFTKEELALGERLFDSQPDSPWTAFCELSALFGSMSLERRQKLYDVVAKRRAVVPTGGGFVNEFRGEGPTRKMIMHGGSRSLDKAIDLAIATVKAQQDAKKTDAPYELVARAIKGRVEAFSERRLNDGDDVWRERELELRFGVAATANAIAVEFAGSDAAFDLTTFAAACGLYVSDGHDTYSDCHPGELTWERPRTKENQS